MVVSLTLVWLVLQLLQLLPQLLPLQSPRRHHLLPPLQVRAE